MVAEAAYPARRKVDAASQRAIRAKLTAEYAKSHARQRIAGFSGGNDSMVVAHVARQRVEYLLSLSRSDRRPGASRAHAPYEHACVQPHDVPNPEQSRFHSVTGS